MTIQKAQSTDHKILTQITKLSKAHWGYSAKQLKIWEGELTILPHHFDSHEVFKLLDEGQVVAYYSFKWLTATKVYLENVFIHPDYIGKGYGKLLLFDFEKRIKEMKPTTQTVSLDSDPNAASFYLKYGYQTISKKESSIPGRYLPKMEKQLNT